VAVNHGKELPPGGRRLLLAEFRRRRLAAFLPAQATRPVHDVWYSDKKEDGYFTRGTKLLNGDFGSGTLIGSSFHRGHGVAPCGQSEAPPQEESHGSSP
jgi:hypothetical protein